MAGNMIRNVSKLLKHIPGVVSSSEKHHGLLARVAVGIQSENSGAHMKAIDATEQYDKYYVHKIESPNKVHVSVEGLSKELQSVFIENYLETLEKLVDDNEINSIRFNFINEDVFRCQLNMRIRKLGYTSSFQRYVDDRGIAEFKLRSKQMDNLENRRVASYHRMAYTKTRKTDILNIVM